MFVMDEQMRDLDIEGEENEELVFLGRTQHIGSFFGWSVFREFYQQ